jgi:hypothetical protein
MSCKTQLSVSTGFREFVLILNNKHIRKLRTLNKALFMLNNTEFWLIMEISKSSMKNKNMKNGVYFLSTKHKKNIAVQCHTAKRIDYMILT